MAVRKPENPLWFDPRTPYKVTEMGNIIETMRMQKKNQGSVILNIDKDHYVDLRTGELKDKKHIESRAQDLKSMRRTLAQIRALVNTNVTDALKCRWVTLTYSQEGNTPMNDTKRLYGDYKRFWMRFKRHCERMGYGVPEYLTVIEPQGSGAWHCHCFFIWQDKAPFIPNDPKTVEKFNLPADTVTMAELWEQGFTKTKALNDIDNIGAYFSAYLGDMPLDEVLALPDEQRNLSLQVEISEYGTPKTTEIADKKFIAEDGTVKEKKFVKGGRLFLYPPKMNIVRKSGGIKLPIVEFLSEEEKEKKVSAATETFSCEFEILDDAGKLVNAISKKQYNKNRRKKQ